MNRVRMEHICRSLNFQKFVIVEANGLARGLTLMWKEEVDIGCVWSSNRPMHCVVKNDLGKPMRNLLACSGIPYHSDKRCFWEELGEIVTNIAGPWLLIREFNKVVDTSEKFNGRPI